MMSQGSEGLYRSSEETNNKASHVDALAVPIFVDRIQGEGDKQKSLRRWKKPEGTDTGIQDRAR